MYFQNCSLKENKRIWFLTLSQIAAINNSGIKFDSYEKLLSLDGTSAFTATDTIDFAVTQNAVGRLLKSKKSIVTDSVKDDMLKAYLNKNEVNQVNLKEFVTFCYRAHPTGLELIMLKPDEKVPAAIQERFKFINEGSIVPALLSMLYLEYEYYSLHSSDRVAEMACGSDDVFCLSDVFKVL